MSTMKLRDQQAKESIDETVALYQDQITRPNLIPQDFVLPHNHRNNLDPQVLWGGDFTNDYGFVELYQQKPTDSSFLSMPQEHVLPVDIYSLGAQVSVESRSPLVYHFSPLPLKAKIDFGTVRMPIKVENNQLVFNLADPLIATDGGKVSLMYDSEGSVLMSSGIAAALAGLGAGVISGIASGGWTAIFGAGLLAGAKTGLSTGLKWGLVAGVVTFVGTSLFYLWLNHHPIEVPLTGLFYNNGDPALVTGVPGFPDKQFYIKPQNFGFKALDIFKDEYGNFPEKISFLDLKSKIEKLADEDETGNLFSIKSAEEPKNIWDRLRAGFHYEFDKEFYVLVSGLDASVGTPFSAAESLGGSIKDGQIYFEFDATVNRYEVKGQIPITGGAYLPSEKILANPVVKEFLDQGLVSLDDSQVDFAFDSDWKQLVADVTVGRLQGTNVGGYGSIQIDAELPSLDPLSPEIDQILENIPITVAGKLEDSHAETELAGNLVLSDTSTDSKAEGEVSLFHQSPHLLVMADHVNGSVAYQGNEIVAEVSGQWVSGKMGGAQFGAQIDHSDVSYDDVSHKLNIWDLQLADGAGWWHGFAAAFGAFSAQGEGVVNLDDLSQTTAHLTIGADNLYARNSSDSVKIRRTQVSVDLDSLTWDQKNNFPEKIVAQLEGNVFGLRSPSQNLSIDRGYFNVDVNTNFTAMLDNKSKKGEATNFKPTTPSANFDIPKMDSPLDFVKFGIGILFRAEEGFITTQKSKYDSDYFVKWEGKGPFCLDLARNKWIRQNQKRMAEKQEGILLYEGEKGIYRSQWIDFGFKPDTRMDFWLTQSKEKTTDEFGSLTSIDAIFSPPLTMRLAKTCVPLACIHGVSADLKKGQLVIDWSPWPDSFTSPIITKLAWSGQPAALKAMLEKNGYDEKFPADLEVWMKVFDELDLKTLDDDFKTSGNVLGDMTGSAATSSELVPVEEAESKSNIFNGRSPFSVATLPVFHMETKLPADRALDLGFASFKLMCGDQDCADENLNRVIVDVDPKSKKVEVDLPQVGIIEMTTDGQVMRMEDLSARKVVFTQVADNAFELSAGSLQLKALTFEDKARQASVIVESSQPNSVTNFSVKGMRDALGAWFIDTSLVFNPADGVAVHLIDGRKQEDHYLSFANTDGMLIDLTSEVTGGGDTGFQNHGWTSTFTAPDMQVTLGMSRLAGADLPQTSNPFELGFQFYQGFGSVGMDENNIPFGYLSGEVIVDSQTPLSFRQQPAPGVTAYLSANEIDARYHGDMILEDNLLTVSSSDRVAPIVLSATGEGSLQLNTTQVQEIFPDLPAFGLVEPINQWTVSGQLHSASVLMVPNDDPNSKADFNPQVEAIDLDKVTVGVYSEGLQLLVDVTGLNWEP